MKSARYYCLALAVYHECPEFYCQSDVAFHVSFECNQIRDSIEFQ